MKSAGMDGVQDILKNQLGVTLKSVDGLWFWQVKPISVGDEPNLNYAFDITMVLKDHLDQEIPHVRHKFFLRRSRIDQSSINIACVVPDKSNIEHINAVKYKTLYFGHDPTTNKFGMVHSDPEYAQKLIILGIDSIKESKENIIALKVGHSIIKIPKYN